VCVAHYEAALIDKTDSAAEVGCRKVGKKLARLSPTDKMSWGEFDIKWNFLPQSH